MSRGRKPLAITHLIFPTTAIAHKKKTAAEVRLPDSMELVFSGKSRHECAKWIYGQKTESVNVKPLYKDTPYTGVTAGVVLTSQKALEFYDQSSKSKVTLVPSAKVIYGSPEKPKYAAKADFNGKSLVRFISKAEFDTMTI